MRNWNKPNELGPNLDRYTKRILSRTIQTVALRNGRARIIRREGEPLSLVLEMLLGAGALAGFFFIFLVLRDVILHGLY